MFVELNRCVIENNKTNINVNHQKSMFGFTENSINKASILKIANDECLRKKAIVKIVRIEDETNNEYIMKRKNLNFTPNMIPSKNMNESIDKSMIISNPLAEILPFPFMRLTSIEESNLKVDCKWKRTKIFCMYCKKLIINFSRHIAQLHKDQEPVKEYLQLPKYDNRRRILLGQIARRGNFLYNIYTKSNTRISIANEQQLMNFKITVQDYPHQKNRKIKKCSLNSRKKNFKSIKNVNEKNNNKQSFTKPINDNVDDVKVENVCVEDSMNEEGNLEMIDDDTESIESDFEIVRADPCTISKDPAVIPNLVDAISPNNLHKKSSSNKAKPSSCSRTDTHSLKTHSSNANHKKSPKLNCCFFCKRLVIKMSRHLLAYHHNEKRVKEITKLPKYDLFRRRLMSKLCQDGNILHDEESRANKKVSTKSQQQQTMLDKTAENFVVCTFCHKNYAKIAVKRHYKLCTSKHVHEVANDVLRKYVFPVMNSDSVAQLIKYDKLIVIMGNKWTEKHDYLHHYDHVRFNLKLMGSFKEALLRHFKNLNQLSSVLRPDLYDTILEAIYECSNKKKTFAKAAKTAFLINSFLKTAAEEWISDCIKRNNEVGKKNAEKFIELCNNDSSTFMNFKVLKKKVNNIRKKKRILTPNGDKDNFQLSDPSVNLEEDATDVSQPLPVVLRKDNQNVFFSTLKDKDEHELRILLQTILNKNNSFTSDNLTLKNNNNEDKLENDNHNGNNDDNSYDNNNKVYYDRTVIRKRWTEAEREAVIKYFGDLKKLEKLPTLKQCEIAILGDPAIGHRTPPQLKKWIHYQRKLKSS